jgi:hypothetical protein
MTHRPFRTANHSLPVHRMRLFVSIRAILCRWRGSEGRQRLCRFWQYFPLQTPNVTLHPLHDGTPCALVDPLFPHDVADDCRGTEGLDTFSDYLSTVVCVPGAANRSTAPTTSRQFSGAAACYGSLLGVTGLTNRVRGSLCLLNLIVADHRVVPQSRTRTTRLPSFIAGSSQADLLTRTQFTLHSNL